MPVPLFLARLLLAALFIAALPCSLRAADTNAPPQLTIELRDGSRLVGTSGEKSLKFHSALLGDLKLEIKDIRSVECISSNSTKLVTSAGDTLDVSFSEPITVKTSFGKVDLAADSIRKITVLAMSGPGGYPPGLAGLWTGSSEGKDSVAGDDAQLIDVTFADGIDGQAFSFNGVSSEIKIPASAAVDLGAHEGFTLMAWIKPMDVSGIHPIFQWLVNETWDGDALSMWMGMQPDENGVLRAFMADGGGFVVSQQGVLVPGVFQHIAFTYDKASGNATLYVNGVTVAQRTMTAGISNRTKGDLWVGRSDVRPGNWSTGRTYSGLVDDIAIFDRVLTESEIAGICAAQSHGEQLIKPTPSSGWWDLMR